MADLNIDQLNPASGTLADADQLIVSQGTTATRKASVSQLPDKTDIGNLAPGTPVATDAVVFEDADDNTKKQCTVQDLVDAAVSSTAAQYGQIYGCPGAGQSMSIDATYSAIPTGSYDSNGLSSTDVTPDETNGRIQIDSAGVYEFHFHASIRRSALITDLDFALFEFNGNTELPAVRACDMRIDAQNENFSLHGFVNVTAGQVFEVRGRRPLGANTIEFWYASLACRKVS